MEYELITSEAFRKLADIALNTSKAEHTLVSLSDRNGGTTRFANNQIVQNVNTREQMLTVTVASEQRQASASTTDLSESGVQQAVREAEAMSQIAPADPEYMPPLEKQFYPHLATYRPETAQAGPERLGQDAALAISKCRDANLSAAGIVSAYASVEGLAANSGLFAYEPRTRAEFSLTATGADSSGWVDNANRSIDDLGVGERTQTAIDKANASAHPRELEAGEYPTVLEPAAVAGLIGPAMWMMDAKAYDRGTSPLSGKLGQSIIDSRLTLKNRPDHPSLLGDGFDGQGLPSDYRTWIDRGVLRQLRYDRFTAKTKGVEPSYSLDAPYLEGNGTAAASVDELIRDMQRGVLVTNFWYIRMVNPTDLTLTGMTRDGTFLIENGRIAGGLINFRWHDSPLRALNRVAAFTSPMDAITIQRPKMMLPALRLDGFHFSSVTRF
jgi:predicted Zn-dependent protease